MREDSWGGGGRYGFKKQLESKTESRPNFVKSVQKTGQYDEVIGFENP